MTEPLVVKCRDCVFANETVCLRNPPVWTQDDDVASCWAQPRVSPWGCGQGERKKALQLADDCDRWRDANVEPIPLNMPFRAGMASGEFVIEIRDKVVWLHVWHGPIEAPMRSMKLWEELAGARFWRPVAVVPVAIVEASP